MEEVPAEMAELSEKPASDGVVLATSQGVSNHPLPPRRRPGLKTLHDVRREMARVYRDMRGSKIKSSDGTRYAYVLASIGKLIESAELQARIEALEALQAIRGQSPGRALQSQRPN
jgi:hypothetical protein